MVDELTFVMDDGDPTVVVEVRGVLTLRSATTLGVVLRKLLMDRGRVVAEVTFVSVRWAPALAVFATVLAHAGGWPLARLVLVDSAGEFAAAMRAGGLAVEVPVETDRAA